MKELFFMGQIVATPGALDALSQAKVSPIVLLKRHVSGDWGELCDEDVAVNKEALENGFRLMSVYSLPTEVKVWIITEADRSVTTILLPEEY